MILPLVTSKIRFFLISLSSFSLFSFSLFLPFFLPFFFFFSIFLPPPHRLFHPAAFTFAGWFRIDDANKGTDNTILSQVRTHTDAPRLSDFFFLFFVNMVSFLPVPL